MATGKRFYWMKLKDSFMNSDTIDYFMSQPGGANYVVLYQMLCLKTINTHGRLSRKIGEVIIPYDVEKIQRDCKYFSIDTVRTALGLFKAFGLIFVEQDGTLVMADHDNLVGSETDYSVQKRGQRGMVPDPAPAQPALPPPVDAPQEPRKRFKPPTLEEAQNYFEAHGSTATEANKFINYYTSNGWHVGKAKMVNWHSSASGWISRQKEYGGRTQKPSGNASAMDDLAELQTLFGEGEQ